VLSDIGAELVDGNEAGMKEQVRRHDSFGQWISAPEIDHCADCRRGR
jgi:hypothetical protein